MEGIQLRVGDLIYAIKKRWKIVLLLTIAGLFAGIAMSGVSYLQGTMTRNYQIRASAVFLTETDTGYAMNNQNPVYDDYRMARDMADTAKYVLRSARMFNTVLEKTELLGVSAGDISSNFQINVRSDTPIMEFTLTWRSADEGIMILQQILDSSTEVIRDTMKVGSLSVVDGPTAQYMVGGGLNVPTWGLALALGFMLGIAFVVLELLLKPTLITLKDVQTQFGLETFGVIEKNDKDAAKDILSDEGMESVMARQFASASYIIKNRLGNKKKPQILYVTSTGRGEGKTSVAANVAVQLSEMEHKVLLVDFDTKNPTLGQMLLGEVQMEHSLNALYRGDIVEAEAITKVNGYLDVIPVLLEHHPVPIDSGVIEMIEGIKDNYDYIIMDTPPVGDSADMLSLNQIADNALFVIGYDMMPKSSIMEAIDTLDKSGIRIIGCIVNQDKSIDNKKWFEKEDRPSGTRAKKNRKKKKESLRRTEKRDKKKESESVPVEKRNVQRKKQRMEGIIADYQSEQRLSDEETMEELLKIGLLEDEAKDQHEGEDL